MNSLMGSTMINSNSDFNPGCGLESLVELSIKKIVFQGSIDITWKHQFNSAQNLLYISFKAHFRWCNSFKHG